MVRQRQRRDSIHRAPIPSHAMIPFAFPTSLKECPQSAQYLKRATRLALVLFRLTALLGLAVTRLV